jgi:hypothetical protein
MIEEETARGWRDPEIMDILLNLHNTVIIKPPSTTTVPTAI